MKLYVTYSFGSNLRDCYSVVNGLDVSECFAIINKVCAPAGGIKNYAFTYTEEQFAGQAEEYHLTEVPLQEQVMERRWSHPDMKQKQTKTQQIFNDQCPYDNKSQGTALKLFWLLRNGANT